jgi:hypothetical protein
MADAINKQQNYYSAKKDREENFTYEPCPADRSSVQPCIEKDKFKIVGLVEVIKHKGKESTQKWKSRNQYIHFDPRLDADNPHPDYGRCIRLKARVEWISGSICKMPDGRIIKWSYKSGVQNRPNLSGENKEGFDRKGGTTTLETVTDAQGWTPVVEFYLSDPVDSWQPLIPFAVPRGKKRLSQYNGDTFDIIVTDENNESLRTGLLTVIGLIDWLPGWVQMQDPDIPTLKALQSMPEGIVLHCGESRPGVAEYLRDEKDRRVSAHFAWSVDNNTLVQMVPLDIVARHAGEHNSWRWWGLEMSGPAYLRSGKNRTVNLRTPHEWGEFDRLLKKDTGLLHLVSGGHLKYYCFHRDINPDNREDLGPDSMKPDIQNRTGLTWRMP